jgi:hypothetical protein
VKGVLVPLELSNLNGGAMFSPRAVISTLTVFALAAGQSARADAAAIYISELDFSLGLPQAEVNLFGYGGPLYRFDGFDDEFGDAEAEWVPGTGTTVVGPGGQREARIVGLQAFGIAGPGDGAAYSESWGRMAFRLANLSGSGGPTPPAQEFLAPFTLSFSFSLDAFAMDPALESSEAGYVLYVRHKPEFGDEWDQTTFERVIASTDSAVGAVGPIPLSIPLPPNSITLFEIQGYAFGRAVAVELPPLPPIPPLEPPPPVPEPASVLLVGAGMAAFRLVRRL